MEVSRLATLGDKDNDELKVLSNPNSFDNVRICSCKNVEIFYAGAGIRDISPTVVDSFIY